MCYFEVEASSFCGKLLLRTCVSALVPESHEIRAWAEIMEDDDVGSGETAILEAELECYRGRFAKFCRIRCVCWELSLLPEDHRSRAVCGPRTEWLQLPFRFIAGASDVCAWLSESVDCPIDSCMTGRNSVVTRHFGRSSAVELRICSTNLIPEIRLFALWSFYWRCGLCRSTSFDSIFESLCCWTCGAMQLCGGGGRRLPLDLKGLAFKMGWSELVGGTKNEKAPSLKIGPSYWKLMDSFALCGELSLLACCCVDLLGWQTEQFQSPGLGLWDLGVATGAVSISFTWVAGPWGCYWSSSKLFDCTPFVEFLHCSPWWI